MQTHREGQRNVVGCSCLCKQSEAALLPHTDAHQPFSISLSSLSCVTNVVFADFFLSLHSFLVSFPCFAESTPEGLEDLSLHTVHLLHCPHWRIEPFQPHYSVATDTQLVTSSSAWVSSNTPGQLWFIGRRKWRRLTKVCSSLWVFQLTWNLLKAASWSTSSRNGLNSCKTSATIAISAHVGDDLWTFVLYCALFGRFRAVMEKLYATVVPRGFVRCMAWSSTNLVAISVSIQSEGVVSENCGK